MPQKTDLTDEQVLAILPKGELRDGYQDIVDIFEFASELDISMYMTLAHHSLQSLAAVLKEVEELEEERENLYIEIHDYEVAEGLDND